MTSVNKRIGIDLGGTKTEVAVLDQDGATIFCRRVPTPRSYDGILSTIRGLVNEARSIAGPGASIGIGTPGTTSRVTGLMIDANSTMLIGKPLYEDLVNLLGHPISMANDANCFVLSEARDGAARDCRVVFGVILGTGVGGGIAVDKHVWGGANAIAGEWGHNPLPWPHADERPGPRCYCGKHGCVETFLSGPALAREKAEHGGQPALEIYEDRLARALAGVINVLDPDAIVFGGGVSNIERLYANVPNLLPRYVFADAVRTRVLRAMHGDSSGVRGAAMLGDEPSLMSEESKTYTDVDRAQVDKLRSQISAYVQLPPGDGGTIESQGMKGRFAYDEAARTLTLTLDEVPFYVPRGMIWSTIERALGR